MFELDDLDEQESFDRELARQPWEPPDDPTDDPYWDNSAWGEPGCSGGES